MHLRPGQKKRDKGATFWQALWLESSAKWRRPLSRSRVQLHGEERKGAVTDQEAAPGSAGPSNSGGLASGSGDTTKPTSISLPEDVISTVFEKTGPIVESCWVARCV